MIMLIDRLAGLAHIEIITHIAFIPDANYRFQVANVTLDIFVDEVVSVDFLFAFDLLLDGLILDQLHLFFRLILHFNLYDLHFLQFNLYICLLILS